MVAIRARRVRKSGNLARWFVIPPATVLVASTAIGTQAPREFAAWEWLLIALYLGLPTIAIGLSLFVGTWLTVNGVTIRSWFRTYRFQRADVVSFDLEEYGGALRLWPFDSAFLVLAVELADEPWQVFPSTIATHRSLVEQIRQLDEHFGTHSFAARPGQSPAAIRAAKSRAWTRSRRSRDGL